MEREERKRMLGIEREGKAYPLNFKSGLRRCNSEMSLNRNRRNVSSEIMAAFA